MNATAWAAIAVAAALAATDWVGVATGRSALRIVGKPGTMVALIVAATTLEPSVSAADARPWFVVALVLSLAGDVLLMLPTRWFVSGLAAFLLAHVAYVGGLVRWRGWPDWLWLASGCVVVLAAVLVVGRSLLTAVRRREPAMAGPVGVYLVVISAMVIAAFGTSMTWLVMAALLFYASDSMLGWNRFAAPKAWAPLAVMVTYHLAQGAFVLSLAA